MLFRVKGADGLDPGVRRVSLYPSLAFKVNKVNPSDRTNLLQPNVNVTAE